MAIRIPSNLIKNKYTAGKEYILKSINSEYIGYYYELNGKIFAGKEFNVDAPELVSLGSTKHVSTNSAFSIYKNISNISLPQGEIESIIFDDSFLTGDSDNLSVMRYFAKKVNEIPIKIIEISKDTFNNIQNNPLYQTLSMEFSYALTEKQIDDLDKQMPGLKLYIEDSLIIPGASDEINPYIDNQIMREYVRKENIKEKNKDT